MKEPAGRVRHQPGRRPAYHPISGDDLLGHAEQLHLLVRAITDHAAQEPMRRVGQIGERRRQQPAGHRFGHRHGQIAPLEQVTEPTQFWSHRSAHTHSMLTSTMLSSGPRPMSERTPFFLRNLSGGMLAESPNQDLGELIQIALDVAGSLEPREVIARILERGTHTVQADRATLSSLVDDHVVIEATYGRAGELTWVGQRYSRDYFAGQPLVQKAIDTLQPTFGGRLAADQAAPEFRQALASVRHVAVIPLVHGDRAIGMLVLSRYEDRAFTQADVAAPSLLGTISGLALRNARLYEEGEAARTRAVQTAARIQAAVDAAEDVASQVELGQVLSRLLERAAASVGADGTSLARLEGAEMVIESTPTGELVGTRWPLMPQVLAGVSKGRAVELSAAEYTGAPAGLESVVQPYRRFLVAPLVVGGETIGLLAMGRKTDEPFDPGAVQALQQFSTLGALLLRNARLIAQAQVAEQAKSEFMSIAVHELRAPLTVASGYLGMALEGAFGDLPPALKDVLTTAQGKAEEAKLLADEPLAVAHMEGKVPTPNAEAISVM